MKLAWVGVWGREVSKLIHEIAFGFSTVTLIQPLEYQKLKSETPLVDKQLGGKAEIVSCHSCLTFGLVKWA